MQFKLYTLYFLICTIVFGTTLNYNSTSVNNDYYSTQIIEDSNAFLNATKTLDSVAQQFSASKSSVSNLKEQLATARHSFKRIEFYTAFKYAEFIESHINGAPLHKVSYVKNRSEIKPPEGLQILDELIYSEDVHKEAINIASLTKKLYFSSLRLHKNVQQQHPTHSELITALRIELIRIFTLGVSGFDTPGSLNGISETKVVFDNMSLHLNKIDKQSHHKSITHSLSILNRGATYFNETNFENFDRLGFLKEIIDPLYKTLGEFPLDDESYSYILKSLPLNLNTTSLFDDKLLDPYFYTDLTEKEDSKLLTSLGKSLFYDTKLSTTNTVSCASCHNPKLAFTDGLPKPISFKNGDTLQRNTPTLLNAVYANRFFYDLRAFNLEQQAEHVIFNENEFNSSYTAILNSLSKNEAYTSKFKNTFGDTLISRERVLKALASYTSSLRSFNSSFDRYVKGESQTIPESVANGFNLFMGKANCATCHFAPTFAGLVPPYYIDSESEVLGVLKNPRTTHKELDDDKGRITNGIHTESAWMYVNAFKTTTVRNIEVTAPYFHNGAYKTLEEVIDFYNNGGGNGVDLNVTNQTLSEDSLNLSEAEKQNLIAFLKSLTDTASF
ncbi:cytochrome-c peroxidase [Croceibacter atlanticus]|uniref:cytochrome-c peroxidase n=1 Tax=Croceibacter atlanticus TaxID=313588 RepID=UPI0030D71F75|tara:strand:+ start:58642 stop:60483 length:1842 start_codon:yes stop_codon:yes gene_type:complete